MKRFGLLRHAKSDWSHAGRADFDRPLNARGEAAARAMAPVLAECDFELVLASTARRVRETVALAGLEKVQWEERIYGADPGDVMALVGKVDPAIERLLVVGHNPTMHQLANRLARADRSAVRQRLDEKYPTAALAVVDVEISAWDELGRVTGVLERFVRPKDL
jgi:phosphohistidine phosphatase